MYDISNSKEIPGNEGSGQLRMVAKKQKVRLSAKTAKKVAKQGGRGGRVSGLTFSALHRNAEVVL